MRKNKRGWIQIVEAVVAVLLVATVLLITINKGYIGKSDISESVYKTELSILREIETNDNFRTEMITLCNTGQICQEVTSPNQEFITQCMASPCQDKRTDLQLCDKKLCGVKRDNCGVLRLCGSCSGTSCNSHGSAGGIGMCETDCSDPKTDLEICGSRTCGFALDGCGNPRTCGLPIEWNKFPIDIKAKITERTPDYLTCEGKICAMTDTCVLTSNSQQDVYAQSVVISATIKGGVSYKQLKLFCWQK